LKKGKHLHPQKKEKPKEMTPSKEHYTLKRTFNKKLHPQKNITPSKEHLTRSYTLKRTFTPSKEREATRKNLGHVEIRSASLEFADTLITGGTKQACDRCNAIK